MNLKFNSTVLVLFAALTISAQREPIPMVGESDSIPSFLLDDINIEVKSDKFKKEYENTKWYVLRVYDYAMIASAMLQEFEDSLTKITKKRDQNKYIDEVNDYLKNEFGEEIADMSITRGMYLMKIIHKETGLTTFDIIKTYQSGLKAMWWQSVVSVFGTSLKYTYDPEGEDAVLAAVLRDIEAGKLKPIPRAPKTDAAKKSLSKKEQKKKEKLEKKNKSKNAAK
jgi:NADPH:quinone reductase-like Zn-dependent oxidoreductase